MDRICIILFNMATLYAESARRQFASVISVNAHIRPGSEVNGVGSLTIEMDG